MLRSVILTASMVLAACTGPSDPGDIVDQQPRGHVEGVPWAMTSAVVRVDQEDGDTLHVALFPEAVLSCTLAYPVPSIHFDVERMPGEYPLHYDPETAEPGQVVTFSPHAGENYVAMQGVIVVDQVSDSDVSIGVFAATQHSDINGRFTATICQ